MRLQFQRGDDLIALDAEPDGDGWRVRLPDGSEHRIAVRRLPDEVLQIERWSVVSGRWSEADSPQNSALATEHSALTIDHRSQTTDRRFFRVPFARTERGVE